MSPELEAKLKESAAVVAAMSPRQLEAMYRAQRESWARAFQPCEHGVYDFEDCGECRK